MREIPRLLYLAKLELKLFTIASLTKSARGEGVSLLHGKFERSIESQNAVHVDLDRSGAKGTPTHYVTYLTRSKMKKTLTSGKKVK